MAIYFSVYQHDEIVSEKKKKNMAQSHVCGCLVALIYMTLRYSDITLFAMIPTFFSDGVPHEIPGFASWELGWLLIQKRHFYSNHRSWTHG